MPALLLLSHAGILLGWAKPVPVNPRNFRNYRWGEATVSTAGPLSNLALAVVFAALLHLGLGGQGLLKLAYYGVSINIILALFNLFPIPPLDSYHILSILLPPVWPACTTTWSRWASSSSCSSYTPECCGP